MEQSRCFVEEPSRSGAKRESIVSDIAANVSHVQTHTLLLKPLKSLASQALRQITETIQSMDKKKALLNLPPFRVELKTSALQ